VRCCEGRGTRRLPLKAGARCRVGCRETGGGRAPRSGDSPPTEWGRSVQRRPVARTRPQPGRACRERPSERAGVQPAGHTRPGGLAGLRPSRAVERPAEQGAHGRHPAARERRGEGARSRRARAVTGPQRGPPGTGVAAAGVVRVREGSPLPRSGKGDPMGAGASREHLPRCASTGGMSRRVRARSRPLPRSSGKVGRGPQGPGSPGGRCALRGRSGVPGPGGLRWRGGCGAAARGRSKPSDGPSDRQERGPAPAGGTGTGLHERAAMSRPGGNHGERVLGTLARASARVLSVFGCWAGEQAA
jgi:hypothetical protein